jgi:hypothetical protein
MADDPPHSQTDPYGEKKIRVKVSRDERNRPQIVRGREQMN